MEQLINQITQVVAPYLPRLVSALGILIVGWIIALIAGALMRGALRRTTLDNRLASWFAGQEAAKKMDLEAWVGKAVYYLVMLFVLVAVFQTLGLTMLTEPLRGLLTQIFEFAPRLLGAGLLLFIAWALGSAARLIVTRALGATKLDQRLADEVGEDKEAPAPVSKSMGDALYWFVFLLFLPGVLDALALEGMLDPVKEMVSQVTGFLPNLLTAGITLAVGWFLARIVQRIVTSLLAAVGLDALSQRVGLAGALGDQKLSRVLGMVVYVLIFIPILIGALTALQLNSVTEPLSRMLTMILEAIPAVFAAMLVLTISYMVGRVVAGLVTSLLSGIGFDAILARLGARKRVGGRRCEDAVFDRGIPSVDRDHAFCRHRSRRSVRVHSAHGYRLGVPRFRRPHRCGASNSGDWPLSGEPGGVDRTSQRFGSCKFLGYDGTDCDCSVSSRHGAETDGVGQRDHQSGVWSNSRSRGRGRGHCFWLGWT